MVEEGKHAEVDLCADFIYLLFYLAMLCSNWLCGGQTDGRTDVRTQRFWDRIVLQLVTFVHVSSTITCSEIFSCQCVMYAKLPVRMAPISLIVDDTGRQKAEERKRPLLLWAMVLPHPIYRCVNPIRLSLIRLTFFYHRHWRNSFLIYTLHVPLKTPTMSRTWTGVRRTWRRYSRRSVREIDFGENRRNRKNWRVWMWMGKVLLKERQRKMCQLVCVPSEYARHRLYTTPWISRYLHRSATIGLTSETLLWHYRVRSELLCISRY